MANVPRPISVMVIEEGVLAADQVAEPAEEQRAERADREASGKGEQREDERRRSD